MVCLGHGFRPSTRLRGLIRHFYQILSSRVAALDNAFDPEAAQFFLRHQSDIQALRAKPLWRRPVALRVQVREVDRSQAKRSEA
jgi:hypothetical protein